MIRIIRYFRTLLRAHIAALIFAIIVGILSVLPHLLAVHALGSNYQGIPFLYSANEDYYLSRINEIADGHPLVGSPYFYEYKQSLPLVPPIGEYTYIILGFLLQTSLPATVIIAKFLYPAILFLLSYGLIRALSNEGEGEKNILGAIAGALCVTLGFDFVDYHTLINRLLHGTDRIALSLWVRSVNPITGALFLIAYLSLLWNVIRKNSWHYAVLSAVVLALSCGYIFSFLLGIVILGGWWLILLYEKNFSASMKLIVVGGIALTIDALYWVNVIPYLSHGQNAERSGMLFIHTPLLNKVILATLFVLIALVIWVRAVKDNYLLTNARTRQTLLFAIALPLSGMLALNQQVLTGRAIWPYHFVQYTVPLSFVTLFVFGFTLIRPYAQKTWRALTLTTIIMTLSLGLWNAGTYVYQLSDFKNLQQFAPTFAWLNANTEKDCVVLGDEDWVDRFNNFLPAFTHCNAYLTGNITNIVPDSRIKDNFFVKLRLLGVSSSTAEEYLNTHEDAVKTYFYKDWLELLSPTHSERIGALTPVLAGEYRVFLAGEFSSELKKYRIDYIVSSHELSPEVAVALKAHITPVFQTGSTTIYAFR